MISIAIMFLVFRFWLSVVLCLWAGLKALAQWWQDRK